MRMPIRGISGAWPRPLERRAGRFFWPDPRLLLDPDADPADFRRLMSQMYVGGTIKITSANRHPDADRLLVDHLTAQGRTDAAVVDIGASDGTTSLDLIAALPGFASYTIADLHLAVDVVAVGGRLVVFDSGDGSPAILVSGRRLLGWPSLSAPVMALYAPLVRRAAAVRRAGGAESAVLLNPAVRSLMGRDPRITATVHDVFTEWPAPLPDVIKIANLLRSFYFSRDELLAGLTAAGNSLPVGGLLLIAENPRVGDRTARGGLYERRQDGLALVAKTPLDPELDELMPLVRLRTTDDDAVPGAPPQ